MNFLGKNVKPRWTPPKSSESTREWAFRLATRVQDATNTVNNRIDKRRKREKLAKASRKRNRGK